MLCELSKNLWSKEKLINVLPHRASFSSRRLRTPRNMTPWSWSSIWRMKQNWCKIEKLHFKPEEHDRSPQDKHSLFWVAGCNQALTKTGWESQVLQVGSHLSVPPYTQYKMVACRPIAKMGTRIRRLKTRREASNREKLKVPPRPFPLEEQSHYNHSGQLQVFFTQLEPNSHGVRQSSHASVETNSNKRISVLGTNHTKIYRVNLVGFKHSAEDPSRSPHHQNKYTLRSKRFSNVLTNHQGRFPQPWNRSRSKNTH